MNKKIGAMLLVIVMVVSVVPTMALAECVHGTPAGQTCFSCIWAAVSCAKCGNTLDACTCSNEPETCPTCGRTYDKGTSHTCPTCETCGEIKEIKHTCPTQTCSTCGNTYTQGTTHTCPTVKCSKCGNEYTQGQTCMVCLWNIVDSTYNCPDCKNAKEDCTCTTTCETCGNTYGKNESHTCPTVKCPKCGNEYTQGKTCMVCLWNIVDGIYNCPDCKNAKEDCACTITCEICDTVYGKYESHTCPTTKCEICGDSYTMGTEHVCKTQEPEQTPATPSTPEKPEEPEEPEYPDEPARPTPGTPHKPMSDKYDSVPKTGDFFAFLWDLLF